MDLLLFDWRNRYLGSIPHRGLTAPDVVIYGNTAYLPDEGTRYKQVRVTLTVDAVNPPVEATTKEPKCTGYYDDGRTGPRCCPRAGEYNGFGSDGPRLFTCPQSCGCHD